MLVELVESKLRDHYYVELRDGSLAVITGNMHFQGGFIGYVKYQPTKRVTPWSRSGVFYERVVKKYIPREVHEHTEWRLYIPHFDSTVPYIPLSTIRKVYNPVKRAEELYSKTRDILEKIALDLVDTISVNTSVRAGITGSLLPGIHNTELSDVDIVIYGVREALRVIEFIESNREVFKSFTDTRLRAWSENIARITELTPRDIIKFYRNWRRGVYESREYSIIYNNGVYRELTLLPSFKSLGTVHLVVEIAGGIEALNYPSAGRILNHRVLSSQVHSIPYDVVSVVSYEALYTTGLYEGGLFEVKGLLQCSDFTGECRVLLGVLENPGFMRYRDH